MSTAKSPFDSVEIRQHPSKGRSLHTTRSFAPGDVILVAQPLLCLPTLAHLDVRCTHCFELGQPRACTRCRAAYYCNATCQRAAWQSVHKHECKALQRIAPEKRASLPTPVRLLLQTLLIENIEKGVGSLEGNVAEKRVEREWKDIELMAMAACSWAGKPTDNATIKNAAELLCKIQNNAFNWTDDDFTEASVFVEPTLAMMNHSCLPNAMVLFVDGQIVLRADTALSSGDEIEISYTDFTAPLSKRVLALKSYKFRCQCRRCKEDLNVYQACAISSNLDLNRYSLTPEVTKVAQLPVAAKPTTSARISSRSEELADLNLVGESNAKESPLLFLRERLQACEDLISLGAWAAPPVPELLATIAIYLSEKENFASALVIQCLIATECTPYRYIAPFHLIRSKELTQLAHLLSNTAPATASQATGSVVSSGASNTAGVHSRIQTTLMEIDQASTYQMLMMTVLHLAPAGFKNTSKLAEVTQSLENLKGLQGRERELSLIHKWAEDPESDWSMEFFRYAVIDPVHRLAAFAEEVLKSEFED